jgi:hypothetical protein
LIWVLVNTIHIFLKMAGSIVLEHSKLIELTFYREKPYKIEPTYPK